MDESAGQKVATIKVDPQDRLRARDNGTYVRQRRPHTVQVVGGFVVW